jgi:hypothetical protein
LLVAGAANVVGSNTTLNSVSFAPGGTLTLDSSETLIVAGRNILTQRGATASLVGGRLDFASLFGQAAGTFVGDGDLTVGSRLMDSIVKAGTGTLTLLGDFTENRYTLTVMEGRVRLGSAEAGGPRSRNRQCRGH